MSATQGRRMPPPCLRTRSAMRATILSSAAQLSCSVPLHEGRAGQHAGDGNTMAIHCDDGNTLCHFSNHRTSEKPIKLHAPWFRSVAASFQAFVAKWMLCESCTCRAMTPRLHHACLGSHALHTHEPVCRSHRQWPVPLMSLADAYGASCAMLHSCNDQQGHGLPLRHE